MSLIDIPFHKLNPTDILRPWLEITIKNPHTGKELKTYGLIDTGADECALPALFAPILGHNLQAGEAKQIDTGNGQTQAYSHTMCLKVDNIEIDDILIDFLPNLKVVLLGMRNFLANFILTVDYPRNVFSLLSK